MLSLAAKTYVALAAASIGAAVLYGAVVGDRSGTALFVALAFAALTAGFAVAGTGVRDAPSAPVDADAPPASTSYGRGDAGWPSSFPFLAAVALGVFVIGLAAGRPFVTLGIVLLLATAGGWFGHSVRDHGAWAPAARERVGARLLRPLGIPVATFLLLAIIAVSFSRVLLAVNKDLAAILAVVVAFLTLAVFSFIATRPEVKQAPLFALVGVAAIAVIGAGVAGGLAGEREFHHHEGHDSVSLEAVETKFDKDELQLPAGEEVEIDFDNRDVVPHNFAIYTLDGEALVSSAPFSGPSTRVYRIETPEEAGTYQFICEIHPTAMVGALELE